MHYGSNKTKSQIFNKQKKIIAGGFIIFGILILFLGFTQIKNKIYKPFDYLYKNNTAKNISSSQQNTNLEELKNKDTDRDGLSDYDELYVYFTSPYLKDSDSDGISDKAEIEAKTDPNCPTGKTCDKTGIPQTPRTKQETENNIINFDSFASSAPATLSTEQMRQILLQNGISQEQLNKVDDETLKKIYNETVKETGINPVELTPDSPSEIPLDTKTNETNNPINLQGMSVDQMRQFLLQSGMSETELKQIDDETLKTLFQKAAMEAISN
ncbi:MAG: thrombospondin type 3 repeat-containing protein [Patescibacteria group bacterium]